MMFKRVALCGLFLAWLALIFIPMFAHAATINVNTKSELTAAISAINPGDTIVVENGTYTNWGQVTILHTSDCTQAQPCTLTAQTEGSVVFSGQGALTLDIRSKWWTVSKLKWTGQTGFGNYSTPSASSTGPLIVYDGAQDTTIDDVTINNVSGTGAVIAVIKQFGTRDTLRNTLSNSTFDGYTHTSSGSTFIYVLGRSERGYNTDFNIIGNVFKNRVGSASSNSQYWIRYGSGGTSSYLGSGKNLIDTPRDSNFLIEGNLFQNDTPGSNGQDTFHLKASYVEVRGNTFENVARLVFRHGQYNKIIGNIFKNPNTSKTDHALWVADLNHEISNNLFYTTRGDRTAIQLSKGNTDVSGDNDTDYPRFSGSLLHNTFDGFSDESIIASKNSTGTGGDGVTTLNPIIVDFQNNVIRQQTGTMVDGSSCATLFSGNVDHNAWSGSATPDCITQSSSGNVLTAPQWVNPAGGDYHLLDTSPLIDAGTDASGAHPEIAVDLDGVARGASPDIGAYEVGASGPSTFYVNSACITQGNGTTTTCGANGPWTSIEYALEVVDCAGMTAGDVLEVRGMTAVPNAGNWYSDTYYDPANSIDVDSACSGISLRYYSGATEYIVVDGTVALDGLNWTSLGSGVYESAPTSLSVFPHRAWYKIGAGSEQVLSLIQSVQTCSTSLAVFKMSYNPISKTVCAHLSDGSSPADTTYFRVPGKSIGFNFTTEDVDDFSITGTGARFLVTRFADTLIDLSMPLNQNITLDGLTLTDALNGIIADGGAGAGDYNITNNSISNIGEVAIKMQGYLGSPTIIGNTISGAGLAPNFEKCSGVGAGCLSGFNTDATGLLLNNCVARDDVTRATVQDNTITNVGEGYAGTSYGIHSQDCTHANLIDSNLITNSTASSQTGFRAIHFSGIPAGQYHDHIQVTNNRMEAVDYGLTFDYDTATDQTGMRNFIYGNTCSNPNTSCVLQESGPNVGGELWFKDNLLSTDDGDGVLLINVGSSTMWTTSQFANNGFECDHANCSGATIATFQGSNYKRSGDCTPLTDCIEDINAFNNIYGACNVTATSLDLPAGSACIDAGVALGFLQQDYKKTARNCAACGAAPDIGAHEYDGSTPTTALTQTSYKFGDRFRSTEVAPLAPENKGSRLYVRSQFSLRFAITGDAGTDSHQADFALYCQKNAGGYTQVTTTCTGNVICLVDDPTRADGSAISNDLALNGRAFLAASAFYDTAEDGITATMAGGDQLELEFSAGFGSTASLSDVVDCRVQYADGSTLGTYSQAPSITIGPILGTIFQAQ